MARMTAAVHGRGPVHNYGTRPQLRMPRMGPRWQPTGTDNQHRWGLFLVCANRNEVVSAALAHFTDIKSALDDASCVEMSRVAPLEGIRILFAKGLRPVHDATPAPADAAG